MLLAITLAGVISSFTVDIYSYSYDDAGDIHSSERVRTYYSGDLVGSPWAATFDEASSSFAISGRPVSFESTYFTPPDFGGSSLDGGSGGFTGNSANFFPLTNRLLGTYAKFNGNLDGDTGGQTTTTYNLSPASFVPEPSTWFIMLIGFGLIGARRRICLNLLTLNTTA